MHVENDFECQNQQRNLALELKRMIFLKTIESRSISPVLFFRINLSA